jgi:hypothetical protein
VRWGCVVGGMSLAVVTLVDIAVAAVLTRWCDTDLE